MPDTGTWTKDDWLLYYEFLVDFLYDSLGPANDDIMAMAEQHAMSAAGLE